MQVTVNHDPVEVEIDPTTTLAELLDSLGKSGHIPAGEIVVGLAVDGRQWSGVQMQAGLDRPLSGAETIEVETEGLKGYGRRVLDDAVPMLDALGNAARAVARELREDTVQQANADLYNLLETLQQLLNCLTQVQNSCDPEGVDPVLSTGPAQRLVDCLDEVQECQRQQDWPRLALALEEQMAPTLADMKGPVQALRDAV